MAGRGANMPLDVDRWRADPALSMCSEATRGVWIDWLTAMWQNGATGVLEGDVERLAKIGRASPETVTRALRELNETQTADITQGDGGMYIVTNRRMKREYDKRNGAAQRQERFRNAVANVVLTPAQETLFERFWAAFPRGRKKSKTLARAAFAKAILRADPERIIAAAAEYALSEVAMSRWVKMPSTWLNQDCWDDDRASWQDQDRPRAFVPVSASQFHELYLAGKFQQGYPQRDPLNPNRVYGILRDNRSVECTDYPRPRTEKQDSRETTKAGDANG